MANSTLVDLHSIIAETGHSEIWSIHWFGKGRAAFTGDNFGKVVGLCTVVVLVCQEAPLRIYE